MIGLAVLAGVAIYISVFWFIVRALKQKWAKGLAILVALAIPFWDLPVGYLSFSNHCRGEGGLKQLAKITPNKSILFSSLTGIRPDYLFRSGVELVEYSIGGDAVRSFKRLPNGSVQETRALSASSAVRLQSHLNTQLAWNIYKNEAHLVDVRTGQTLATATSFYWLGGWIQRLSAPMLAGTGRCYFSSLDEIVSLAITGSK
jgi:hypothetical protein